MIAAIKIRMIIIYWLSPEMHLNQWGQTTGATTATVLSMSLICSHKREKTDYAIMKPYYNFSALAPVWTTLFIQSFSLGTN